MIAKHYTVYVNEYGTTELIADDGWYMFNGDVCATHVYLGKYDCEANWQAVEHYIEPQREQREVEG